MVNFSKMKDVFIGLMFVASPTFAWSCSKSEPEPGPTSPERTILVYMAVNNNLSSAGREDFEDIKNGYVPGKDDKNTLLVYLHEDIHNPALVRLWKQEDTVLVDTLVQYPAQNSCMDTTMNKVLKDAFGSFPAPEQNIILSSHGTGWLPAGFYDHPKDYALSDSGQNSEYVYLPVTEDPYAHLVKSYGHEWSGTEMEIPVLRNCLGAYHFGFVCFDCCLTGGAEVAYELKDVCDYVIFSQAEILADGFPYTTLMEAVFDGNNSLEGRAKSIAEMYYEHYASETGSNQSATISVVKTGALEALASSVKSILNSGGRANTDTLTLLNNELKYVQRYFRANKHWFYDLDDYIANVCPSDSLYDIFCSAMSKTVIYKAATPWFLKGWDGFEIKHFSGLSIYVDRPKNTYLEDYYKTLAWGKACGF